MATVRLACTACTWTDERDAATRPPSTCPSCGHNEIAVDGQPPAQPASKKPAPRRRR